MRAMGSLITWGQKYAPSACMLGERDKRSGVAPTRGLSKLATPAHHHLAPGTD